MKKKIRRLCAILAVLLIMILLVIGVRKYAHEQFLANFEILTREEMEAQLVDFQANMYTVPENWKMERSMLLKEKNINSLTQRQVMWSSSIPPIALRLEK